MQDSKFKKIHFNLFAGFENIVQTLIEHGANINATNNDGESALLLAAAKGSENMVKLLIENGADVNIINKKNESVLIVAINKGI